MKIHHIAITVANLETSKEFYKSIFGLVEDKRFERPDLNAKAVFLKSESIFLEVWEFSEKIQNKDDLSKLNIIGIRHVEFEVDNLDSAYEDICSKGFSVSKPQVGASGGRYSFLSDPNGISIELYEPN